jgi:Xaa-Pro aminopeptidase
MFDEFKSRTRQKLSPILPRQTIAEARIAVQLAAILVNVALDISAVQKALRAEGLDGWLLYDFQGSNPIASSLTGLAASGKMTTRRWYYLIPAQGEPRGLVHAIERHNLDELPGAKTPYAERTELETGLKQLLSGMSRIAMEYSPNCAIPYISRVDGGTMEAVRETGVEVVSSGDLVQMFGAVWSPRALETHRIASEKLYCIKDQAYELVRDAFRARRPINEFDVQQQMIGWFEEEGLVSDSTPNVSAQENAGNPHYHPSASVRRAINKDEILLLDLWGKLQEPGAVFADITWVAFTGSRVPEEYAKAFAAARDGRDAAITLVQDAARGGRTLRGWEVDRVCRKVIDNAGFGRYFVHRTGHSLGQTVHGNGVHMDDYETHDERRLLPGTGFTIEPGVYTDKFGVRTEINMYVGEREATVTGPAQREIVTLA